MWGRGGLGATSIALGILLGGCWWAAVLNMADRDRSEAIGALQEATPLPATGEPHAEHGTAPEATVAVGSKLETELRAARMTLPGLTVADALLRGYAVADPEPDGAVHLYRKSVADADLTTFKISEPPMLLAEGTAETDRLLAIVYWVENSDDRSRPPEGFEGKFDVWHRHRVVCDLHGEMQTGDTDDALTLESCVEEGGRVESPGGWMLHAWIFPGVDSPSGTVFDSAH